MNDIVKKNIQEKLEMTMTRESLKPGQVAKFLDLIPGYISMIRKEAQWEKCPKQAWEAVLLWVNSGESLVAYKEKQIKSREEAIRLANRVFPLSEKSPEDIKIKAGPEAETIEETAEELFKAEIIPEAKTIETDVQPISLLKTERNILIDLLETERNILNNKLQAISSLLKIYSDQEKD